MLDNKVQPKERTQSALMNKTIKSMTALFAAAAVTVTAFAACSKNGEINGIDTSAPVAHIENPPNGKKDLFTIKYGDFFGEYNFFMARGDRKSVV